VPFVRQGVLRPVTELVHTHRAMAGLPPLSEVRAAAQPAR